MYFLKRAFLYLKNKKGKTLLLGIIFLVIANFVLAGLLVQNASEQAQINTRMSIGADVQYGFDTEELFLELSRGEVDREMAMVMRTQGLLSNNDLTLKGAPTYQNVLKVVDSDYVESYDMSLSFQATGEGLTNYVLDTSSGDNDTSTFDISLFSALEPSDFTDENAELTSGRFISQSEIDSKANVVLIEETIAEINNLEIGNTITLTASLLDNEATEIDYEIIGIYMTNEESNTRNASLPQNTLYVHFDSLNAFGLEQSVIDDLLVNTNVIKLKDPLTIEEFKVEAEEKVDMIYGNLSANDALYNSLIGPIESLGELSGVLVIIIAVAGALIIGLITALTVNERKEEIGILLAVGEYKLKVVSQFVIEVVVIALVAFMLSTFTGAYIGDTIKDAVLNSDMLEVEETTTIGNNMAGQTRPGQVQNNTQGQVRPGQGFNNTSDMDVEEAEVDINLSVGVLLQLLGLGILLSAVSTMVPALYVMRFNPKQILTNRNT